MEFKKPFEVYKSKSCPAGSPIKDENQLVMDGNNMTLKKVGTINVQKMINSYRDTVDLGKMIERFKRGDQTALNRGKGGFFADVSEITPDLAEQIENNRLAARYVAEAKAKVEKTVEKEKTAEKTAEKVEKTVEKEKTAEKTAEEVNNG